MQRYVLRNKLTGKFFVKTGILDTESSIDALIFNHERVAGMLANTISGYELCLVQFSVNSCDTVPVDHEHKFN